MSGNPEPRARLRDALASPDQSAVIAELVPWRGGAEDPSGQRGRQLADELTADPRFSALSITDNAGGHAMLSPEVLAAELVGKGTDAIVHVACRDRNRNELISLGWRLAGAGVTNVLALSGDYPTEGYLGVARPVFDVDSVALVALYRALAEGRIADGVVGRPIPRDCDADIAPLAAPRGMAPSAAVDLHLGVAVNPFKVVERDQIPQYLKLERKVRAGAEYAVTQVGFDMRKLGELVRYAEDRELPVRLVANFFLLTRGAARVFASGEVPGIQLPPALLEAAEQQGASPDKGKSFFADLAARQVAIARGLGFHGIYLGGASRAADYVRILDLAESYQPSWQELVPSTSFEIPGTWYAYDGDPSSGLAGQRQTVRSHRGGGPFGGAPLAYRMNRMVHAAAFDPHSPGARAARPLYLFAERHHLGRPLHVFEEAIKIPLFDCRDCGDCSLPDIAYLCPESQCVKNQRNGPCGGSTAGECEVPGKTCIWARAYQRLAPYGEIDDLMARQPVICDNALRRTSSWSNTYLGRDHATRPAIGPGAEA